MVKYIVLAHGLALGLADLAAQQINLMNSSTMSTSAVTQTDLSVSLDNSDSGEYEIDIFSAAVELESDSESTQTNYGLGGVTPKEFLKFMKGELKFHSTMYTDYRGVKAVGYGKNIDPDEKMGGLTNAEMKMLLESDITRFEAQLTKSLPWYPSMPDARRGALLSMAMQIGFPGILKFKKTLKAMENKQWDRAANEMADSAWARQTPNRSKRLQKQVRTNDWQWKPGCAKAPLMSDFYDKMFFLFAAEEGSMPYAYKCSSGAWTVGIGRNIDPKRGGNMSEPEAAALLLQDVKKYARQLDMAAKYWRKANPARQKALIALAHGFMSVENLLKQESILKRYEEQNWAGAAAAINFSRFGLRNMATARRIANIVRSGQEPQDLKAARLAVGAPEEDVVLDAVFEAAIELSSSSEEEASESSLPSSSEDQEEALRM